MIGPVPSPHDPFVPPNWRWERARQLRSSRSGNRHSGDDPFTKLARAYQSARAKCRTEADWRRLERKYPGVHYAWELHEADSGRMDKRWSLEAFLLSRAKPEQIAHWLKISPDVVIWYEKLLFNVLPYLDHDIWIVQTVMRSAIHYGLTEREYDLLWKMIGFAMGPIALRHLILPLTPVWVADEDQLKGATEVQVDAQTLRKMLIGIRTVPVWNNQEIIFEAYNRAREIEKGMGRTPQSESLIIQNVQAALVSMSCRVGAPQPREQLAHDRGAAELRVHEQMEMALTGRSPTSEQLENWKFPDSSGTQ
jgi:hypothetical protein